MGLVASDHGFFSRGTDLGEGLAKCVHGRLQPGWTHLASPVRSRPPSPIGPAVAQLVRTPSAVSAASPEYSSLSPAPGNSHALLLLGTGARACLPRVVQRRVCDVPMLGSRMDSRAECGFSSVSLASSGRG